MKSKRKPELLDGVADGSDPGEEPSPMVPDEQAEEGDSFAAEAAPGQLFPSKRSWPGALDGQYFSEAVAVRRRSWGYILADLLGNASLENCTSLGVCPTGPRQGAAAVTAALGEWMIQYADSPILLVEANLRHPYLSQLMGSPTGPGLTEAFFEPGVSDFDVIHETSIPGVSVLPAGKPVPRHRRKQIGKLFSRHYQALSERFPNMIIDLPAIGDPDFGSFPFGVADAVLLVIQPKRTSVKEVQSADRRLKAARANLVASMLDGPETAGSDAGLGSLFSSGPF